MFDLLSFVFGIFFSMLAVLAGVLIQREMEKRKREKARKEGEK
jgi:hypothetical protein